MNVLPNELIAKIVNYSDSQTKRALSLVNCRIHGVVLNAVRSIVVFPRNSAYPPSNTPLDILVKAIRRYPHLNEIFLEKSPFNWCSHDHFGSQDTPYLKSLIKHLNKSPLKTVKSIEFLEIPDDFLTPFDSVKAKKLNHRILNALGHSGLQSVKIRAYPLGSILSGYEIQSILDQSANLKSFTFNGFQSDQDIALSFHRQRELLKVKLIHWRGPASTLESLQDCRKLRDLVIHYEGILHDEIKTALKARHWNLSRLELSKIPFCGNEELDALAKQLPNLECLRIELEDITDDGMEVLGVNCQQLRILKFSNKQITDLGLNKLTQHLPNLEIISFDVAFNVTGQGVASIALNCPHLQFIKIVHFKEINKSGFDALSKNCPNLTAVGFTYGGPISLKGLKLLAARMPNLCYLELYRVDYLSDKRIENFYKQFPQIKKITYTSSAKELQRFT